MNIREIADKAQDTWNDRDEEGFIALYDAEHEVVSPGFTGKGLQGVRDFWALWNGAFPDNRLTNRMRVIEGTVVAESSTFQGTHTGPLMSPDGTAIPPTGRQVSVNFAGFTTVRNGKITNTEFHFDQLDMLTQLGLAGA